MASFWIGKLRIEVLHRTVMRQVVHAQPAGEVRHDQLQAHRVPVVQPCLAAGHLQPEARRTRCAEGRDYGMQRGQRRTEHRLDARRRASRSDQAGRSDIRPCRSSSTDPWPASPLRVTDPLSPTSPPSKAQLRVLAHWAIWRRSAPRSAMASCWSSGCTTGGGRRLRNRHLDRRDRRRFHDGRRQLCCDRRRLIVWRCDCSLWRCVMRLDRNDRRFGGSDVRWRRSRRDGRGGDR